MRADALLDELAEMIAERVSERLAKVAPAPPSQSEFLTTVQVAKLTGLGTSTLENYRHDGVGPKWVKLRPGGQIRYSRAELETWLKASR